MKLKLGNGQSSRHLYQNSHTHLRATASIAVCTKSRCKLSKCWSRRIFSLLGCTGMVIAKTHDDKRSLLIITQRSYLFERSQVLLVHGVLQFSCSLPVLALFLQGSAFRRQPRHVVRWHGGVEKR